MVETQVSFDVRSLQTTQPPGFIIEAATVFLNKPSYMVIIRSVDWKNSRFPVGIHHSTSRCDALIKYSEARFSPVSRQPAECIQLATPRFYRDFEAEKNSELIADELDAAYVEKLNWNREGSAVMEHLKQQFRASTYGFGEKAHVELTFASNSFLMYCTSINPNSTYKCKKQRMSLSPTYDFVTRIENPSLFAKQLAYDFGSQIDFTSDIRCENHGLHTIASNVTKLTKTSEVGIEHTSVDYFIFVDHGRVIYLNNDKIAPFIARVPNDARANILPFVKQKNYQEQQEYRFVVLVRFHTPIKETFNLKVTNELRLLMTPIENVSA